MYVQNANSESEINAGMGECAANAVMVQNRGSGARNRLNNRAPIAIVEEERHSANWKCKSIPPNSPIPDQSLF